MNRKLNFDNILMESHVSLDCKKVVKK